MNYNSYWKFDLFLEIDRVWTPLFWKELLISQNWDRQPTVKFHSQQYTLHIYWLFPKTSTFMLYAAVNATRSPKKATDWSGTKSSKPSKEIRLSWYQSIDKTTYESILNLKVGYLSRSQGVRLFQTDGLVLSSNGGDWKLKNLNFRNCELLTPFFVKSCAFLGNEMNNPPSIFTGNTTQCISIDWYLETSTFMLYAAVSAVRSPKKATNWSGIKNGKSSKEIRPSWYQSIDKKHL
jgi:hypothetical protein